MGRLEQDKPGWKGLGWCGTRGDYYGQYGNNVRCPEDNPTWCICKWATAAWIKGHAKCDESIEIDCPATDVCATDLGLFFACVRCTHLLLGATYVEVCGRAV